MPNVLQLAQTAITYSNLVVQLMLGEAQKTANHLQLKEPGGREFSASAKAEVTGREIYPSGKIITPSHEFHFVHGVLTIVRKRGLEEKLGPKDELLAHYTNHSIALPGGPARIRLMEILAKEGFDVEGLQKVYDFVAVEEPLSAFPKPGFPLKQFTEEIVRSGEIVSVEKAKVAVEMKRKPGTSRGYPENVQCEFFGTTGELRELRMLGKEQLEKLGLCKVNQLSVEEGTEEIGPAVTLKSLVMDPVKGESLADNFQKTWRELIHSTSGKQLRCVLFSENINQGEALAKLVADAAGPILSVGFSHPWRDDLAFSAGRMARAAEGGRGFQLLAITGNNEVEFKAKDFRRLDATKNHLVFNLQSQTDSIPELMELESSTEGGVHGARHLDPLFGSPGSKVFVNGKMQASGDAFVILGGVFPLESILDPASQTRVVSHGISHKYDHLLDGFAQQFTANPLARVFNALGDEMVKVLEGAERVEIYRVKSNTMEERSVAGRAALDGHEILATAYLEKNVALETVNAVLDARNIAVETKDCLPEPTLGFRLFRGKDSVGILYSPRCQNMELVLLGAENEIVRRGRLRGVDVGSELVRIARGALP